MSLPWIEKYRPTTLAELIDQEGVVKSLKNILSTKEVPHMLFTGPPGVGKCVSHDTPILLGDGRLVPVEQVKRGYYVYSLDESGRLVPAQVQDIYHRRDRTFRVRTLTGAVIEATGEHPFLTMEDGYPIWKRLNQLRVGDWLASPLRIRAPLFKAEPNSMDVTGFWAKLRKPIRVKPDLALHGLEAVIVSLIHKSPGMTHKELCREILAHPGSVRNCLRGLVQRNIIRKSVRRPSRYFLERSTISATIIPLSHVRDLSNVERAAFRGKFHGFSAWVHLFGSVPDFYEWLGLLLSEGKIEKSRLVFYNKNRRMIKRFARLTRRVFGLHPKVKSDRVEILRARSLTAILRRKFDVYIGRKKSHNIRVPPTLYVESNANLASFIRGYFYGDGSFYRNTVEIASSSEQLLYQLKVLLLRLGIIARLKQSRLLISGRENIRNFATKIRPSLKTVQLSRGKAHTNIDLMPLNSQLIIYVLRRLGMNFDEIADRKHLNRLLKRQRSTRKTVQSIYRLIARKAHEKQAAIHENIKDLEDSLNSLTSAKFPYDELARLRSSLAEASVKEKISTLTEIRHERLREYVQGTRIPRTSNLLRLFLAAYQGTGNEQYRFAAIRLQHLTDSIRKVREASKRLARILHVSNRQLAQLIGSNASTLHFVLSTDSTALARVQLVASATLHLKKVAQSILDDSFLRNTLTMLNKLSRAEIFWDRVKAVEDAGEKSVCDISVAGTHNFLGGRGLLVLHNTAAAHAFARDLYGPDYLGLGLFVEVNASDERGIQTIREKVKTFARSPPPTIVGREVGFRILLLDESDQLTDEAQHAFRRTMEQFSATCRFVLAANYSNRIIAPIQSRCAVLRFRPLPREAAQGSLQRIAESEKLSITQEALEKVYDSCGGDLRRCINTLQSAASLSTKVDAKTIAKVFGEIDRMQVRKMLDLALTGKFNEARNQLRELLHVHGLSGRDLIDSSFKAVFDLDVGEERKMEVLDFLGETDFRIAEGASEEVQLHAFLAKLLPRSKN